MAEHRVCNAGVRGSNPLTSTRIYDLRFQISDLKFEKRSSELERSNAGNQVFGMNIESRPFEG